MRWYEGDGARRLAIDQRIVANFPELRHEPQPDGGMWLAGNLIVKTASGVPHRIPTRIEFPDEYPEGEPRAFEPSARFPHDADHHFIGDRACLWLDVDSKWDPGKPEALDDFLRELVTFYLRQLAMEANPAQSYPGPARPHGLLDGYLDYLGEQLRLPRRAIPHMRGALAGNLSRNAPCPCGSRVRYRHCHKAAIDVFRRRMKHDRLESFLANLR